MKKELGSLTLREMVDLCQKNNACDTCPLDKWFYSFDCSEMEYIEEHDLCTLIEVSENE